MKIRKVSADRLDAPRGMRRGLKHAASSATNEAGQTVAYELSDAADGDGSEEITPSPTPRGEQASASPV